jgi:hypothetical protein
MVMASMVRTLFGSRGMRLALALVAAVAVVALAPDLVHASETVYRP